MAQLPAQIEIVNLADEIRQGTAAAAEAAMMVAGSAGQLAWTVGGIGDLLREQLDDLCHEVGHAGEPVAHEIVWSTWILRTGLDNIAMALGYAPGGINISGVVDIGTIAGLDAAAMSTIADALRSLSEILELLKSIPRDELQAFASGLVQQVIDAGGGGLETLLGPASEHSPARLATIAEALANMSPVGMWAMIGKKVAAGEIGPPSWEQLAEGVLGGAGKIADWFGAKATDLWPQVKDFLDLGEPADVDNVLERAGKHLLAAGGLGIAAHLVSTILSTSIFGSLGLRATGLAAVIGEFAGYKEILGPIHSYYNERAIGVPWRYKVNAMLHPYMPGMGDVQRFETKRLPNMPTTFEESMARYGFSPAWTAVIRDDMYAEPSARELLRMADVADVDEPWLKRKIERLGFTDDDTAMMVDAVKVRSMSSWINSHIRALVYRFRDGGLDYESLRAALEPLPVRDWTREAIVDYADAERDRDIIEDQVRALKVRYERDQLTDDEFRELLGDILVDPKRVDVTFSLARLGRMKKVYITTPPEDALAKVSSYKAGFVAGLVTEAELRELLFASEMESDVIRLTMGMLADKRDRQMLGSLRRYDLPRWRDQVAHGVLTTAQYRSQLARANMPSVFIGDEVAYASMLHQRWRTQRVTSQQLPAARRAYVLGLISATTLKRLMEEAGLTAEEIRGQVGILTYDREGYAERIRKAVEAQVRAVAATYAKQLAEERKATADAVKESERLAAELEAAAG